MQVVSMLIAVVIKIARSHLQSVRVNIPVNINLKPMGNVQQKTGLGSPEDNRT